MRKHRGMAPQDKIFLERGRQAVLKKAVCDLSCLLQRGYKVSSSMTFVGNHYQLTERERFAISHVASDGQSRGEALSFEALEGKELCIDGFNLIITLETALGGGIVLVGMDGCYRDIAGVHASYSFREETRSAVTFVLETLKEVKIAKAQWLFDRPVSNSGRLAALVDELSDALDVPSEAYATERVDAKIKACNGVAVTTDSEILVHAPRWFDLAAYIIKNFIKDAYVIDIRCEEDVREASPLQARGS